MFFSPNGYGSHLIMGITWEMPGGPTWDMSMQGKKNKQGKKSKQTKRKGVNGEWRHLFWTPICFDFLFFVFLYINRIHFMSMVFGPWTCRGVWLVFSISSSPTSLSYEGFLGMYCITLRSFFIYVIFSPQFCSHYCKPIGSSAASYFSLEACRTFLFPFLHLYYGMRISFYIVSFSSWIRISGRPSVAVANSLVASVFLTTQTHIKDFFLSCRGMYNYKVYLASYLINRILPSLRVYLSCGH